MAQQQPVVSVADPSILRQVERQTAIEQQLSGQPRTVSNQEIIYSSATAATTADTVTVTQSVNNQSGDVVTVYATPNGINVTAVDQTVNTYSGVGATGAVGPAGATGPQGASGPTGAAGATGATGPAGATGATGDRYSTTSSTSLTIGLGTQTLTVGTGLAYSLNQDVVIAYDGSNDMNGPVVSYNSGTGVLVINVIGVTGSGTYTSWSVNLDGAVGAVGATGATGAAGAVGATGATGPAGTNGADGATGATGAAGADGATGATGPAGTNGADGATGATGPQGIQGDPGATGAAGADGATGATGPAGTNGADGATGATGPQGDTGATGPAGTATLPLANGNSSFDISTLDGNVTITANGTATWTFDVNSNLTTASNLVIGPTPGGNGSSLLQYDDPLQVVGEGANSIVIMGWAANQSSPNSIAVIGMNTPYANGAANLQLAVGNNATTVHYWNFDNTGDLTIPGAIIGDTPNNDGYLNWVGNSSGDGNGYTTLQLIPDSTLTGGDQYVILDPTAPGHIHVRAGGTIDNSFASLYLGGEQSYFNVPSGSSPSVYAVAGGNSWTFGNDGNLQVPGSILAGTANTFDIGNNSFYFRDAYFSGNVNADAVQTSDGGLTHTGSAVGINATAGKDVYLYADNGNVGWTFDSAGNLTLPGNTVAINFANGSAAFGNIVDTNLDGSSSNVLYGNGVFAAQSAPLFVIANANITANINTSYQVDNSVANANINFTLPDANGVATGSFVKINPYDQLAGNFQYFVVTNGANSAGIQGLSAPLSANRPTTLVWGGSFWYYSN